MVDLVIEQVPIINEAPAAAADQQPVAPLPERKASLSGKNSVDEANENRVIHERTPDDDPRMAIAAKARQNRAKAVLADAMADPAVAEALLSFEEPSAAAPVQITDDNVPAPKDEPQEVELTIYGKKIKVDKAEVDRRGGVAQAQKDMAAEYAFRQAAEERKEAERILAENDARLEAMRLLDGEMRNKMRTTGDKTPETALPDATSDAAGDDGETIGQRVAKMIFVGDVDGVAKTLDTALKSAAKPQDLRALVDQTLEARTAEQENIRKQREVKAQREAVNKHMASKHGDILADSTFRAAALGEFKRLSADPNFANRDPVAIADEAARLVRTKFQAQPKQTTTLDERRQVKAGMTHSGTAGNAPARPDPAPRTRSSIVERMREARGLPT